MDYVYLRAVISVGLFNAVLEPRHWKSLVATADPWLRGVFPKRRGIFNAAQGRGVRPRDLVDAMIQITSDRWNTRAWILQESFASSGNMVLLFPRHPGYDVDGSMLFCHEKSQNELVVKFETLHRLLQIQASSLQQTSLDSARHPGRCYYPCSVLSHTRPDTPCNIPKSH